MTQVENLKNEIKNLRRKLSYYKELSTTLEKRVEIDKHSMSRERQLHSTIEERHITTIRRLMTGLEKGEG